MRNHKVNFLVVLIMSAMSALLVGWGATTQAQKSRAALGNAAAIQQPLYTEYKGVRLGMTAQEVRTKLGEPTLKDTAVDYFIFSEMEAAQIAYDAESKVRVISADYQNGTGAPPPAAVVGTELETKANGSLYKIVYYDSLRFWVSYSRTTGAAVIVTITIQKM